MLNAGVLTFQEFALRETLPLATLQALVLGFLQVAATEREKADKALTTILAKWGFQPRADVDESV
jgi:hypothetical protein